jgi:hypothetical protein
MGSVMVHCDQQWNTNTMPQLDSQAPSMGMAIVNLATVDLDQ